MARTAYQMLLADLLRARDRLSAIAAQLHEDGVTVAGSTGQLRAHPLLAVEANLRAEVSAALDRLGLAPRGGYYCVTKAGRLVEEDYG